MPSDSSNTPPEAGEFAEIYQRARRRNRMLWVASVIWAATLGILAGVFWLTVQRLGETEDSVRQTQASIEGLESEANQLLERLRQTQAQLETVRGIQQMHTTIFANRLQEEEAQGQELSSQEKEFLQRVRSEYQRAVARQTTGGEEEKSEQVVFLGNSAFFKMREAVRSGASQEVRRTAAEAVGYYERSMQEIREDPEVLTRLGVAYQYAGRWPDSVDALDRAVEASTDASPEEYMAIKLRGLAEIMVGRPGEAVASFRSAIAIVRQWQESKGEEDPSDYLKL